MKRPKVRYTIAGEHTKYIARCMEGEYHSQENPRAEKSVEILNGKETANGVCAYTTNSSNIRTYPDTQSQQVTYIKNLVGSHNSPLSPADTINDGLNAIPMRNWLYEKDRFPCQSGLQRFTNKYGYDWRR